MIKNLAGLRFGRLIAVEQDGYAGDHAAWLCQCDCGKRVRVGSGALNSGNTKSCGCLQPEKAKANCLDMIGRRFGRLEVIRSAGHIGIYKAWECVCECGALTVATTGKLRYGHVKSCGCMQVDAVRGFNFGRRR